MDISSGRYFSLDLSKSSFCFSLSDLFATFSNRIHTYTEFIVMFIKAEMTTNMYKCLTFVEGHDLADFQIKQTHLFESLKHSRNIKKSSGKAVL